MPFTWRTLLATIPVVLLLACGNKQASRDEVQSALRKSSSLAYETEIFVQYISQGRSTRYFALGHLQHLRDEVNRANRDISNLSAPPTLMNALNVDRVQLEALGELIDDSCRTPGQSSALDASLKRIRDIRIALQRASSSI